MIRRIQQSSPPSSSEERGRRRQQQYVAVMAHSSIIIFVSIILVSISLLQNKNVVVYGFRPISVSLSRQQHSEFIGQSITSWSGSQSKQRQRQQHQSTTTTTGLSMMFDQLTEAISNVAKTFGPKTRMNEKNIAPALKQVRRALLEADVNIQVTDTLLEGLKQRMIGTEVMKGITADQQFIKAMYDELIDIMGGSSTSGAAASAPPGAAASIPVATIPAGSMDRPCIILLAGLQGAGKTTVAGKLALYMKEREVNYDSLVETQQQDPSIVPVSTRLPKRERNVLLIAADVYRPAAIQQLQVLGERIGVDVFTLGTAANPVDIVQQGIASAIGKYDTIIIDTAGRQVIDAALMKELQEIKSVSNADETLLIVDAMTGQEAATLTASFDTAVGITGAIVTKMDGDVRGGAAVSVRGVSGKPIKFIGTGEKVADLEPFYADRMASRILGMGDVISLVEKAAAEVSDQEALRMQQKMMTATFDFNDFLQQSNVVSKMGNMAAIAKLMPGGLGNSLSNSQLKEAESRLKYNTALIQSMTKAERNNPDLLIVDRTARSRLQRISRGAGLTLQRGQQFISEFQKMRTLMSRMQKQMVGAGSGPASMDALMAGAGGPGTTMGDDPQEMMMAAGANRAARRAAKKNKNGGTGGKRGFG